MNVSWFIVPLLFVVVVLEAARLWEARRDRAVLRDLVGALHEKLDRQSFPAMLGSVFGWLSDPVHGAEDETVDAIVVRREQKRRATRGDRPVNGH